jgi:hypothetical protein
MLEKPRALRKEVVDVAQILILDFAWLITEFLNCFQQATKQAGQDHVNARDIGTGCAQ